MLLSSKNEGFKVTGSDLVLTDELKELKKLGVKVQIGHEPKLVKNADLVVASSAISKKNPEILYSKKYGLTIIPRAEMLGTLMKTISQYCNCWKSWKDHYNKHYCKYF